MIKLLALDLDGTCLNSENQIEEKTIESLRKLDENGVKFVFSTGRAATSASYIMSKTGINNPFVANNGAISYIDKDTVLKAHYMETEILETLVNYARENELYYQFYDENTFYAERLIVSRIAHLKNDSPTGFNYQVNLDVSDDPLKELKLKKRRALKFQVFVDKFSKKTKEELIEYFKENFGDKLYITYSLADNIEIMDISVDKWLGVREICDFLGIKLEETAAIGDQDNDLPMINGAKIGFAMGNAADHVKEEADFVVSTNNDYGVCEAVEKILEINRNV